MKKIKPLNFENIPGTYVELVAMHAPRSIHDEAGLAAATEIVDAMAGHSLNADQDDYLDLIATLVSAYEQKHHPLVLRKMSPVETLRFILEEAGMNASDLGRLLGNRELGSKILRGERRLSLAHIGVLAGHFSVGAEAFIDLPKVGSNKHLGKREGKSWRGNTSVEKSQWKA